RHHDASPHAVSPRMIRNSLGVIPCRRRNHAASPLIGRQAQNSIQRTSFFERASALLVVHLEVDRVPRDGGEGLRPGTWGYSNVGANPAKCGLYVRKLNHVRTRNT